MSIVKYNWESAFLQYLTDLRYCSVQTLFRSDLDSLIPPGDDIQLRPCTEVYFAASRFLARFNENAAVYTMRLERLCRYLLATLESESPKHSYIGVTLNRDLSISWIRHIKILLYNCCVCMERLKPGLSMKIACNASSPIFIMQISNVSQRSIRRV